MIQKHFFKQPGTTAFRLSLLSLMIVQTQYAFANQNEDSKNSTAVMPTLTLEAMSELDPIKSYVDYAQANVTRNGLDKKDIPQTIDTIDVQKYKIYGANDLSVMLQGTPGVTTNYDTRGDGIVLRGFNADTSDIYRDGIRDSGQIRRSTANIERIEILKGPASVLYGRSGGGGVINMVSKYANFDSKSTVGGYLGSLNNRGTTIDLNQAINQNWAVRLTSEYGETDSFRRGIQQRQVMASPSVTYRNDDQTITWTTQYTYDKLHRIPDRGPSYFDLAKSGVYPSIKQGFAHDGDYIDDELHLIRSDLKYQYATNWNFHWALSYREASQDFDNYFGGTYCATKSATCLYPGYIRQSYAWQQTTNKTITNTFDLTGVFNTGRFEHRVLLGADVTKETREPRLGNYSSGSTQLYGYFNPYTGDTIETFDRANAQITTQNYSEALNLGFFAQDLIRLNASLQLMLGARYDIYDSSTQVKIRNKLAVDEYYSKSEGTFSPNIGLVWQPLDAHSIYTSYSRSFAPFGGSTGVNAVSSTVVNAEPQYNDQFEVGIKSDWLDQRLSTQFSVYDIRKHNIRYQPDAINNPDLWAVAGEHEARGAEFSFIGRLRDNVFIRGGYGYTDAKVKENIQYPLTENNPLDKVSKNIANLFVRYLPTEKLYFETGVTYQGSFYAYQNGNLNSTPVHINGFARLDAAIGYSFAPWNVTLAVNNVTDKQYWRSAELPSTPRNVLLRFGYQF